MTRFWRSLGRLIGLFFIVATAPSTLAAERVVSLNQCLDRLLLEVLPAERVILSTSHQGRVERILAQNPDLIVAGSFTDPRLLRVLTAHVDVHVVQQPSRIKDWWETLVKLGLKLQKQEQLQQYISVQQDVLTAHRLDTSRSVLLLMPNQFSWGQGSWADEVLGALNMTNFAADFGVGLVKLSLEEVLLSQPERVVMEGLQFDSPFARANDWLVLSAFKDWLRERRFDQVPAGISSCPAVRLRDYVGALAPLQTQQRLAQ